MKYSGIDLHSNNSVVTGVRFKLMWNKLTTLLTILTRGECHGDE